jgi:hypothetical protein
MTITQAGCVAVQGTVTISNISSEGPQAWTSRTA